MIVVVDDDLDICATIDEILSHEGYRVLTVPNGLKLLTTLAEKEPDLILLDVNMPAVNGFDLCRALKRSPEFCHIPVVLMSALADWDNQELAGTMGAVEHLHKPFDLQQLTTCVRDRKRNSGASPGPSAK